MENDVICDDVVILFVSGFVIGSDALLTLN